jgi:hypothetical protein
MRKLIIETLDLIRRKALYNKENGNFFLSLCTELKLLEELAKQHLQFEDEIFKEITDLKKLVC